MAAVLVRIMLLAGGLGLAEIGVTSLAVGDPVWLLQLGVGLLLLVAGSAGLIVPLLSGSSTEVPCDG